MKFGLKDCDFEILDKIVIKPLQLLGARVYVFGSRATGNHHPFSDIDLLVEVEETSSAINRALIDIRDNIEESAFPVKVDLVMASDLIQSYQSSVMKDRIEIL